MENNKHIYIVSFGDSKEYKLEYEGAESNAENEASLIKLENYLNAFLKEKFPNGSFAYYTTPKITEIAPEHMSQFESYPPLDDEAVEEIKKVLVREVKVMNSDKELNSNALWSDVND